jgi:hypothetical protein
MGAPCAWILNEWGVEGETRDMTMTYQFRVLVSRNAAGFPRQGLEYISKRCASKMERQNVRNPLN